MRYTADLHVHSHYSRATSKDLNLKSLYQWAKVKGINLVGTGDFTHPAWFAELKEKLKSDGNGFFKLKDPPKAPAIPGIKTQDIDVRFCLTTEISSIYKYGDRVRKNHNLVCAPDLDTVARINHRLSAIGNLEADGRPILGLPSRDLLEIVLEASDRAYLIPAHVWTPWFSTLGSKAGYDSIEACFRDLTDQLFALETGLSSDPAMNRKLSKLDRFTLISNSDAHSPSKLGREANLLDTELSYDGMFNAIKTGDGFLGTYEFFPEEGKYHRDGHRKCKVALDPQETMKLNGICPECGKPLTVGVLHRVEALADRKEPRPPDQAAGYDYIIPLPEVLSEIEGVGPKTKTVQQRFQQVISSFGNEFTLLREVPVEDIHKHNEPVLAEAVRRIRENEVDPQGGYDGVYGTISIFKEGEIERIRGQLGFFGIDEYKKEDSKQAAEPEVAYKKPKNEEVPTVKELNKEQQSVVESYASATLVKAGPGTGKTHTLIEWITRKVESGQANPKEILAVTFTNKAADELKERLQDSVGKSVEKMSIGTFHALAWRWLREMYPMLDTIYDVSDRNIALRMFFPGWQPSERNELNKHIATSPVPDKAISAKYRNGLQTYRERLWDKNAVDLSDLIRQTVEELQEDQDWLNRIQNRYKAIAVDEFQDINPAQYELVKLLAGDIMATNKKLLAIGDADQAIYGFRGSDLGLFFQFSKEFRATEIALRKNYRSTDKILKAAGSVIQNNSLRSGADLVPDKTSQTPIYIFEAENPFSEADYILEQIKRYVGGTESLTSGEYTDSQHSYGFEDIGVLFRTHAVGKALFKAFRKVGIPTHYGDGTAFLSEPPFNIIEHVLHLLKSESDEVALSNLLEQVYGWSQHEITSLLSIPDSLLWSDEPLTGVSEKRRSDIEDLRFLIKQLENGESLKHVIGLIVEQYLPDEDLDDGQLLKKETLLDLAEESHDDISTFLEQMQLNPYTDAGRIKTEGVYLLTFHAAKGLEFPVVFIAGAEEGITPILRKDSDIEEERRLFYVAITRAENELQISWSKERARYGEIGTMKVSRFIGEIPERLCKTVESNASTKKKSGKNKSEKEQLKLF